MLGLGTIINMSAIVCGGMVGLIFKNKMNVAMQDSLLKSTGLSIMFIGIAGALQRMLSITKGELSSGGTLLIVISFAIGTLIGELLKIDQMVNRFGSWLQQKTGNSSDSAFISAFVSASLTVATGAMGIIGSIQEGTSMDHSILFSKALIDFIMIMVMAASMGKGCLFSMIPVGIIQFGITALAFLASEFLTASSIQAIGLVGSILIFTVGANFIWPNKFNVVNMVPTVLIAMVLGGIS